jgi:hypothetical protein
MIGPVRSAVAVLVVLLLAVPGRAASIGVSVAEEDVARLLPEACRAAIPAVVESNVALLDAPDAQFCVGIRDTNAREECRKKVAAIPHATPAGAIDVFAVGEASAAGRDWPGRDRVSNFRRIEGRLPIEKAGLRADRDLTFLCFDSRTPDGGAERCVFPASHWFWSAMSLPDRFAAPPRGVCGGTRVVSFTEYLRERPPPADSLWAIRFLSRAEADAWSSGKPERIKRRGSYNPDHEYAKFFLVNSLAWWRGTLPQAPRPDYAFAVRLPALSLDRILELERSGDAFLNIFEEGESIELTLIDRAAVAFALAQRPEILEDVSGAGATGPELRPYAPSTSP